MAFFRTLVIALTNHVGIMRIHCYSLHYKICTLLKMELRREIKLSGSNEYLCFETNNSRTRSSGFNFHMAFLVAEMLNQRQLIKYA